MQFSDNFTPIPEKFWSFETGEPFKTCSLCGIDLTEPGTNYLIEKAYKKEEVLFEYAMCWDCKSNISKELSRKSLELIANYFDEHVDIEKRLEEGIEKKGLNADNWLEHCLIKGTPIAEADEHHICGQFVDEDLVFSGFPYALSDKAMEDLVELLSDETRGSLDDFSKKLFDIDLSNPVLIL